VIAISVPNAPEPLTACERYDHCKSSGPGIASKSREQPIKRPTSGLVATKPPIKTHSREALPRRAPGPDKSVGKLVKPHAAAGVGSFSAFANSHRWRAAFGIVVRAAPDSRTAGDIRRVHCDRVTRQPQRAFSIRHSSGPTSKCVWIWQTRPTGR
jgi:hypothetical protein